MTTHSFPKLDSENLYFLPLGGSGEIGMNVNLYTYQGSWIMVDLGITFSPRAGFDIVTPDLSSFLPYKDQLKGLVITHGHEDHLGAVAYLWDQLGCPIYATPFTASILKLKAQDWRVDLPLKTVNPGESAHLDPFTIQFLGLTHSIPESQGLWIQTPVGNIFHTGDWKLDPKPVVGPATNTQDLKALAKNKPVAVICDSTNVFEKGSSGSEDDVAVCLNETIVGKFPGKRLIFACFASNVARVSTLMSLAKKDGRRVVLAGRSLKRFYELAQKSTYVPDHASVLEEERAGDLSRDETCILATGSQGEERAALSKIAQGRHPHIQLEAGDVVVFSSRIIPGNELAIFDLQNQLARQGVRVITSKDVPGIHVSGHPHQDELKSLYTWLAPEKAVPVHGEDRHLIHHAELAKSWGVKETFAPRNGDVIQLFPGTLNKVGQVMSGRRYLEGRRFVSDHGPVVKDRYRLMTAGSVFLTLVVQDQEILGYKLSLKGLCDNDKAKKSTLRALKDVIHNTWSRLQNKDQESACVQLFENSIKGYFFPTLKRKPVVHVHMVFLDDEA